MGSRAGAETFEQCFGGALNLNVHFHCVVPDGVFVGDDAGVHVVERAPPSDDEVIDVLRRVVARLKRLLRPRLASREDDARPLDALGAAQAEAMNSLGTPAPDEGRVRKRAAYLQGFSFHAAVHLHANDREGLAHLCGYGARPPFSQERLSQIPDGRLAYRLKRPLGDGRTALLLRPGGVAAPPRPKNNGKVRLGAVCSGLAELLRRLATLVPPPRAHLLRYHGVFAPASHSRREVVPPPLAAVEHCDPASLLPAGESTPATPPQNPCRIPWAELLLRVFRADVLVAPAAAAAWCSPT